MSAAAEPAVPLSTLQPGARAKVLALNLPDESRGRLLEMGLTIGVTVEVVRFAPMGDPLELKVRGSHISLRKSDASAISVQRL